MGDWHKSKNICRLNLIRSVLILTTHNTDEVIRVHTKIELRAINEFKDLFLLKQITLVFPVVSCNTEINV